jgi:hypothetical protein
MESEIINLVSDEEMEVNPSSKSISKDILEDDSSDDLPDFSKATDRDKFLASITKMKKKTKKGNSISLVLLI